MAASKSVVTGAAGFVGKHLLDALVERGDDVVASDVVEAPPRPDVRYEEVDIRDAGAVRALVEGADVVFHSASVVHTRQTREATVWAINRDGTQNVIDACRDAGVRRLVYVSSASAVYEGRDIENGDERLPYSSISQAPYADSKIEAEKRVLAADGDGPRTTAVRPHVVFGPGDTRFLPAVLARARAGKLKLGVGWRTYLSDFTYIDNLVQGLLRADEKLTGEDPVAAGQAYFITNGEPTPFFDFVSKVLERLDLPPIRGRVPFFVAYGAAAVAEAIDAMKGAPLGAEDGMSRFAVRYMCTHHYFSIEKARRELGYAPKVSIDEGIERTCAHLRREAA